VTELFCETSPKDLGRGGEDAFLAHCWQAGPPLGWAAAGFIIAFFLARWIGTPSVLERR
jgi:hypothetical protein